MIIYARAISIATGPSLDQRLAGSFNQRVSQTQVLDTRYSVLAIREENFLAAHVRNWYVALSCQAHLRCHHV